FALGEIRKEILERIPFFQLAVSELGKGIKFVRSGIEIVVEHMNLFRRIRTELLAGADSLHKPIDITVDRASNGGPNSIVRAYRLWRGERPGRECAGRTGPVAGAWNVFATHSLIGLYGGVSGERWDRRQTERDRVDETWRADPSDRLFTRSARDRPHGRGARLRIALFPRAY